MRYRINHRFKDVVVIPCIGLSDNIRFLIDKDDKEILCSDGTVCKLQECVEGKIFEFEEDIHEIYGMDVYSFLKKWYSVNKRMDSLSFFKMTLKKL